MIFSLGSEEMNLDSLQQEVEGACNLCSQMLTSTQTQTRVYETCPAGHSGTDARPVRDLDLGSGNDFANDGKDQSSAMVLSAEQ